MSEIERGEKLAVRQKNKRQTNNIIINAHGTIINCDVLNNLTVVYDSQIFRDKERERALIIHCINTLN